MYIRQIFEILKDEIIRDKHVLDTVLRQGFIAISVSIVHYIILVDN